MLTILEDLKAAATEIHRDQIPDVLGELRKVEARLLARLHAAPPTIVHQPDHLLTAKEAAPRLGCSEGYLYNNWRQLPFSVDTDYGPRFSERGIEEYIRGRSAPAANNISELRTHNVLSSAKMRKTR